MTEETRKTLQTGRKMGAIVGGIFFLIFGIVPGFYFGSYGTLILLSQLMGGPVEPGLITRALVVMGILLGLFCAGAVSLVLGSLAGTAIAYATDAATTAVKGKSMEAKAAVRND
ncbi:MAG: hypothetical protein P8Y66_10195 [Nitrospirota bacterium]|jgi:hypothetical protein